MYFPLARVRRHSITHHTPLLIACFVFMCFLFAVLVGLFVREAVWSIAHGGAFRTGDVSATAPQPGPSASAYAGEIRPLLAALSAFDFESASQEATRAILTRARDRAIAVTGVPGEFKSVHLFLVLTLERLIGRLDAGETVTGADITANFSVLYEGL